MCTLSKPPHADERLPHICARLYQALDWFPEQTHQKEKNTADGVKPSRRFSPKKGRECFYLVYLRMSERRDGLVLEVKVRSCELDSYQIQQDPGKLSQGLCHHLKWILILCVLAAVLGKTLNSAKNKHLLRITGMGVSSINWHYKDYFHKILTVVCLSSVLKSWTLSCKSTKRTIDIIKTKKSKNESCCPIIPKIWPRAITTMGHHRNYLKLWILANNMLTC